MKNTNIALLALLCMFASLKSYSQYTLITPGNNQSNITANSSNAGVSIPQVSLNSLSSASPVVSAREGTLVYNTNGALGKGLFYWDTTKWILLTSAISGITANSPLSMVGNNVRLNAGTAAGQLLSWDGNNWINTSPKPPQTVSNMQPFLSLNYCIAIAGIFPQRFGDDAFIGEIGIFAFNFTPRNWAPLNGQILPIAQNTALFSLLGTTYGGNGQTTFALPDLRGRTPIHYGTGSGLSNRNLGDSGGSENFTIDNKY